MDAYVVLSTSTSEGIYLNEHAQYKRGLGCPQNDTHKTFQYLKNGGCVSFTSH